MNKHILSTLVAASLAAAAPLALAQSANPATDGPQFRHHAQRQQHEQRPFSRPSERIEARLAYLKTALKITDAQLPQWEAFANTLRKHARAMDERIEARRSQMQAQRETRPTAIERLERRQERLATASARLHETLAAAKPLYAALTQEQQKIADELLAAPRPGMQHRRMRHHGRA